MPEVGLKAIPNVPMNLDKRLWDFLIVLKHNFEVLAGIKGTVSNKGVTFGDIVDAVVTTGSTQYVSVGDIDDPSPELASISATENGNLLIASEGDEYTIYSWRVAVVVPDSPYVITGDGGGWIAIGGRHVHEDVSMNQLTASRLMATDGFKNLSSSGLISFLAGTANQIIATATAGGGAILSTPQSLHTGANPTFAGMALTGDLLFTLAGAGLMFGSLYLHEGAANVDISTPGVGVYVQITGWTVGLLNNVTHNGDDLQPSIPGVFHVNWSVSGDSQGNNLLYQVAIFINGVEQTDGASAKEFGTAGIIGTMSGTAILNITSALHTIDLRMKQIGGVAADLDIYDMNFNIVGIGRA